jgi:hypothetical protein
MDIQRIRSEVTQAARQFAYVEPHPTSSGGIYVQAAFQTSACNTYVVEVQFEGYPARMPQVRVTRPKLGWTPHRYDAGNLCYLHPNMWNPGQHNLTFVLARTAKWLNKYDVFKVTRKWPGAETH